LPLAIPQKDWSDVKVGSNPGCGLLFNVRFSCWRWRVSTGDLESLWSFYRQPVADACDRTAAGTVKEKLDP
jgi:hypothetical protein